MTTSSIVALCLASGIGSGFLAGIAFMMFGKNGWLDYRRKLAMQISETEHLKSLLHEANQELSPGALRMAHTLDRMYKWAASATKSFGEMTREFSDVSGDAGAGEGGDISVEQSSPHLPTPAEELRKAVQVTRDEWDNDVSARVWSAPTRIHLALAELLEHIADDMADEDAIEIVTTRSDTASYSTVGSNDGFGMMLTARFDWTAALRCAHAINGGVDK